jgi:anti-anti-sigma factor
LRDLFVRSRRSFANALIVIAAELTLGVMQGIALGIAMSVLMLIYVASHPEGAVLGQLPGTEAYRDVRRHPDAITFPGLLIWRVGGDLFFASIGHMRVSLSKSLAEIRPQVKHVLVDFSSVNFIDVSACDELLRFIRELQNQGITIAFARVRDTVREDLQLGGIQAVVDSAKFYERITDGVHAWQQRST